MRGVGCVDGISEVGRTHESGRGVREKLRVRSDGAQAYPANLFAADNFPWAAGSRARQPTGPKSNYMIGGFGDKLAGRSDTLY